MGKHRLFLGCFFSLIATAFMFAVRGAIVGDWKTQFNLSFEQVGHLNGAGLYPFAISIILFSLIVDKIGYGVSMCIAFLGHMTSAGITIFAEDFNTLYVGTFLFALSNGVVEAVINPVVATVYDKNKTHWLNILHAGWPGGLVLGGLLAIGVGAIGANTLNDLIPTFKVWQCQMLIVVLPVLLYGALLIGQKFPVQERVASGVTYMDMLKEFGAGSFFIVCFLLLAGIDNVLGVKETSLMNVLGLKDTLLNSMKLPNLEVAKLVMYTAIALVPTVLFAAFVRSFGRPMFIFLLLIMLLLATTELGTDSWISDIMRSVLDSPEKGSLFLVYTSFIMFVLRFFAGPIVHKISPLGLLAASAAIASLGLYSLAAAGTAFVTLFAAATLYGFGKTFFWPTTLGLVSEQYPKGGALLMNAIAGVGMIGVGTIGGPIIGILQDKAFVEKVDKEYKDQVVTKKVGLLGEYQSLDEVKRTILAEKDKEAGKKITRTVAEAQQGTLAKIAILPAIMFVCYVILILYFRARGGYKAQAVH